MEALTLGLFCASLLLCIIFDWPILAVLGFGLVLFLLYGRKKGFGWQALAGFALQGIKTIKNMLITFMLIGMLTAFWRAAGTIPVIVSYAGQLIRPSVFLLMTFLLNCMVSLLTGTSFGTAATMGVICATVGQALGISPFMTGGAVLSGAFFGDRCSPVSTSALLVSEVTKTEIYVNIRHMVRSAAVPFLFTCAVYALLGLGTGQGAAAPDLKAVFGQEFVLHWTALLPAAVILLLAAFRVKVKLSMTASILAAVPLCLFLQGLAPLELLRIALMGFTPKTEALVPMIAGGGMISMAKVAGIVCLSASYSGLFKETGLLAGIKRAVETAAAKSSAYAATLLTSFSVAVIVCNQTLAILLADQLCRGLYDDREALALDLEDTAVIVSPVIPWCIAGSVPLSTIGAPPLATLGAVYLIALPLWRLATSLMHRRRSNRKKPSVTPAA